MSKSKLVSATIHQYSNDGIRNEGYKYLNRLLHKVPILIAAKELMVTAPSLYRYLSDEIEMDQVSVMLAAHIIFMCECTDRIKTILDTRPRHNAYYQHERHDVLAARKSNGKGES